MPTDCVRQISREDVEKLLTGRLGLLFGAQLTRSHDVWEQITQHLAKKHTVDAPRDFFDVGNQILSKGVPVNDLAAEIRSILSALPLNPSAQKIAKVRWAAALSTTLDTSFESEFQAANRRRPNGPKVAVLSDLPQVVPPRQIPVFKLLGSIDRDDFALSEASYAIRRARWPAALKDFIDLVKDKPVLCLGMRGLNILLDVVAGLTASATITPTWFLFLQEEAATLNASVISIASHRSRIGVINATLAEILNSLAHAETSSYTPLLEFSNKVGSLPNLEPFSDLIALVNQQLVSPISKDERNRLHDLLFSPTVPRWDAVAHNLDFTRSATKDLFTHLHKTHGNELHSLYACPVIGHAASGKTSILKRLAFDLAAAGHWVFWLKPWFYPDAQNVVNSFFKTLSRDSRFLSRPLFVFLDDPLSLGGLTANDIAASSTLYNLRVILLISVRSSDWLTHPHDDLLGSFTVSLETHVSEDLDDDEWRRFPSYLVSLGIASTLQAATIQVQTVHSRSSRDTLSMLYWLLPSSRKQIAASIRDEYFRLGDRAAFTSVIIGRINQTSQLLKRAYEMVAVSNRFQCALPLEVLHSALGVAWQEWIDATAGPNAKWGLLYEERNAQNDIISYRTRNSVVTDLLIEIINGGKLGHSGEVHIMSQLLAACDSSNAPYRDVCVRVLVPWRNLERLDYLEGLQLYDAALTTLPLPEKTLLHHKGLWTKNVGKDPILAERILGEALKAPAYPYATRTEADEHIHTSIAANILDAIDSGKETAESGRARLLFHLSKASSEQFFNTNAIHVRANLMLRLIQRISNETPASDLFFLVNDAVMDVDRLRCYQRTGRRRSRPQISTGAPNRLSSLNTIRHSPSTNSRWRSGGGRNARRFPRRQTRPRPGPARSWCRRGN